MSLIINNFITEFSRTGWQNDHQPAGGVEAEGGAPDIVSPLSPLKVSWAFQRNTKKGGCPPDAPSEVSTPTPTAGYDFQYA